MAITVNSEPSSITPSRNPVRFKFTTNNYVTSAGVAAVKKFTVTGTVSSGEYLTIAYDDVEITIVCVNSPAAASGYNMPTGDGGTSHKGNMLLYFQANYYLNRDFVITLVGDDFIFTARNVGSAYNITGTDTFVNGAFSTTTTGTDKTYNPNFFILVDVYVEEVHLSGTYTRLYSRYLKPDSSSECEIDISEQLHGFLREQLAAPSYNQSAYSNPTATNKRYYITYCESFGTTPVAYATTASAVKRVIKGGLKHEFWPLYSSDFRTLFIGIPVTGTSKFLTTRNIKRYTTQVAHEYLTFVPGAAIANARLRAKVWYTNGTTTATVIASYASLGAGLTYIFPAGYTQLNLSSLEAGRTPARYFVYIDNSSGIVKSETILYELQNSNYLDKYFIYENSLGGFETLRTWGQAEYGVEIEKEEFSRIAGLNYAATDSDIISSDSNYRENTEVFTGFRSKKEALELIDFVNSRYCFQVTGGKHVPVLIDKNTFSIYRDDNYAYALKFNYKPAYSQQNAGFR